MHDSPDGLFPDGTRRAGEDVVLAGRYRLPPMSFNPDIWLNADKSTLVPVDVTVPWPMVLRSS